MRMNKRVYGVIGISSIMANWNADFSGYPKTISTGETFGSDKALKYTMKKKWQNEGKKILYMKSFFIGKNGNLQPRNLSESYEKLFETDLNKDGAESEVVLKNLFSAFDVKNFGATFAESKNNISITGAVQIGQGMNKYVDTRAQEQQILSPFRDSKEEDAKSSTLGTKIISDEAHYFYSFAINPLAYVNYEELGVTEGYTEEDYMEFKKAAIDSATSFASNSKIGADNEFAMFVETEIDTYLPNLAEYIEFEKNDDKYIIKFISKELLEDNIVKSIEIYFNPITTELVGFPSNVNYFNILTGKEIKEQ